MYVICVLRTALKVVHDIPELYAAVSHAVGESSGASVADLPLATKQELHDEENLHRVRQGLLEATEVSRRSHGECVFREEPQHRGALDSL